MCSFPYFSRLFLFLGVFGLLLPPIYAEHTPDVLILNSYHRGLKWSDSTIEGAQKKLGELSPAPRIRVEYMDWKHHPSKENFRLLKEYYAYKYINHPFDVIIANDDAAFEFALLYKKELFGDPPLVFTGVSEDNLTLYSPLPPDVTGVIEKADASGTIHLASQLFPDLKNLYVVYDSTESGLSMGKEAIKELSESHPWIRLIPSEGKPLPVILEEINALPPQNSAVLLTVFYGTSGDEIGFESFAKSLAQKINKPLFVLYDFNLGTGALGGKVYSGKRVGERAAKLTEAILQGTPPSKLPLQSEGALESVVDYKAAKRFGLEGINLPKETRWMGKPPSLLETHAKLVYATLAILVWLAILALFLAYHLRKTHLFNQELERKNEELEQLNDEITASEEELEAQYEELSATYEDLLKAQKRLDFMAYHDTLTGLNNRAALSLELHRFETHRTPYALILMDADNFKQVNDTLGHQFGDQVIIAATQRLASIGFEGVKLFRVSGDEFIALLPHAQNEEVKRFAKEVIQAFSKPLIVEGHLVYFAFSLGSALCPQDGVRKDEILTKADVAMYHSKTHQKGTLTLFEDHLLERIRQKQRLEKHLKGALERGEFTLHYQPQLHLPSGTLWGFEALLRWNNPELGPIPPDCFIPILEENHQIIQVGTWVLDEACAFAASLPLGTEERPSCVCVNISSHQLFHNDFEEIVLSTLKRHQLPPERLEIEITESVFIDSLGLAKEKLERLRSEGIRVALDDFGTGYSSLSYLQALPITTLKIDKSFIDEIPSQSIQQGIISAIISIGKLMNLEIVAEGVETKEQLDHLALHFCDRIQGYLYAKPLPPLELKDFISAKGEA